MSDDDRCPNCGGLVTPGADWCGLCFTPLSLAAEQAQAATKDAAAGEADTVAAPTSATGGLQTEIDEGASTGAADPDDPFSVEAGADAPAPVDAANPLPPGLNASATAWQCPVCEHENPIELNLCEVCGTSFSRLFADEKPKIDPTEAARLGLIPGYVHYRLGMIGDAVARFVAFIGTLGLLVLFFFTGSGAQQVILLVIFLLLLIGIVAESSIDGTRLARGEAQFVDGRWIIYGFGLVFILAVVIVVSAGSKVTPGSVPVEEPSVVVGPPLNPPEPAQPPPAAPSVVPSVLPSPVDSLSPQPFPSGSLSPGAEVFDPSASPVPSASP